MSNKQELLKSITSLLDDTIAEFEKACEEDVELTKGDVKMQPDENGGMTEIAGQAGDDAIKPFKKEEEKVDDKETSKDEDDDKEDDKEDDKKEDDEQLEKEDEDEQKDDEKEDEKEDENEPKDDEELEKFMGLLGKAMTRLGLIKSEEGEIVDSTETSEEKIEKRELKKSKDDSEDLKKSYEGKFDEMSKTIEKLTGKIDELSKRPVSGKKSLDGLTAIRKSEEDASTPDKGLEKPQVLDKLLAKQQSGDNRVTPMLITKYEQSGDYNLVKEIFES